MDSEELVSGIRRVVEDTSVSDCLGNYENPPGRVPSNELLELSRWYKGLADEDKEMVARAVRDAARASVFGFFCVLDGVRAIEGLGEEGSLELYYVDGPARVLLNEAGKEGLHDIYNSEA